MPAYLAIVLHAHLPFVREPGHERFLEESWLFEAITETYLPLLRLLESWRRDRLEARLALSLTPTLCSMLSDGLLRQRYLDCLERLIELADKEVHRTLWEPAFHQLALFYHERLNAARSRFLEYDGDLLRAFRQAQKAGQIEILASAATHAVLPLLVPDQASIRAQIGVALDHYRGWFGHEPSGFWLPECAYTPALEPALRQRQLRWFILESHGLLLARPKPRYATFAPIVTPSGLVAFARDRESAHQVWSRQGGYPGDPRYRDFYRDIGFDLDLDYLKPHLADPGQRGFTGLKYHRITGGGQSQEPYSREAAMAAVEEHARHFLEARRTQVLRLQGILDRPPIIVAPYDAELFGHWWYEGLEFLDQVVRGACRQGDLFRLLTPGDYLRAHTTHQLAEPSASSWGEKGYWQVWLNERNQWIYPHVDAAQKRMHDLGRRFDHPNELERRALSQASRELLLAQSSDWAFILHTGTSPGYARQRVTQHLEQFTWLYEQLLAGAVDERRLSEIEAKNNLFPDIDYRYWRAPDPPFGQSPPAHGLG